MKILRRVLDWLVSPIEEDEPKTENRISAKTRDNSYTNLVAELGVKHKASPFLFLPPISDDETQVSNAQYVKATEEQLPTLEFSRRLQTQQDLELNDWMASMLYDVDDYAANATNRPEEASPIPVGDEQLYAIIRKHLAKLPKHITESFARN